MPYMVRQRALVYDSYISVYKETIHVPLSADMPMLLINMKKNWEVVMQECRRRRHLLS